MEPNSVALLKKKIQRSDIRLIESRARRLLNNPRYEHDRLMREFAKSILIVANGIDEYMEHLIPVLDMIDAEVRANQCRITFNGAEFALIDTENRVISRGSTFREFLINHIAEFG